MTALVVLLTLAQFVVLAGVVIGAVAFLGMATYDALKPSPTESEPVETKPSYTPSTVRATLS